jgi:hypothetical protein
MNQTDCQWPKNRILTVDAKDMSFACGVARFTVGGSAAVLLAGPVETEPTDCPRVRFEPAAAVSLAYWHS